MYKVGTHIDLSHLNKKKLEREPEPEIARQFEVGTKVFFGESLDKFDVSKITSNMLVLRPRILA